MLPVEFTNDPLGPTNPVLLVGYWYSLDQLFKSRWTLPAPLFLGLQSLTTWCYNCPSPTCNMCGHSHIEKTHPARLFCWTWTKISRGLQNHPVSSYCTTQALPGPGPHHWLFHRFTVFTPVTCSTSSVLHWVQSNCCCLQKKFLPFLCPKHCYCLSVLQLVIVQLQGESVWQATAAAAVCQKKFDF